jgi:predicted transcriptional regulator
VQSLSAKSITVRTEPEILEQLAVLAKSMDRSRNWVIEDALKQYIAQQARYVAGVAQARASLERGEGIAHADLMAEMDALIEEQARAQEGRK